MINLGDTLRYPPVQDIALNEPLLAGEEDQATPPPAHQRRPPPSLFPLSPRLWTSLLALFAVLAVATSLYASQAPRDSLPKPRRVWLRSIEDNHSGLGSAIGQSQSAAAGAKALSAELIIPTSLTDHNYSASDWLNRYKHLDLDTTEVCVLTARYPALKRSPELFFTALNSFCATGELTPELKALEKCTLILGESIALTLLAVEAAGKALVTRD